ncbi:MobA/MobL family protein [Hyphomicrobium sp.]|uniref:MobA/MobL family protein n=1 Tax=Hyphomicrobium sp. TaxID=82 RepID=UPI003566A27A
MPDDILAARRHLDQMEARLLRTNKEVRICDKFIIALPLELQPEERHEVVASYMRKIGKGRIAWCAAHHDQNEDAHNPHAHVQLIDRDLETGKKVLGFGTNKRDVKEATERGWKVPPRMTSGDAREAWCNHLNAFMRSHGYDIQYDHRSHKDRGLEQEPTIHEGPKVHALKEKGVEPQSKDRNRRERLLQYSLTDAGTRIDHNRRVKETNAKYVGKDLTRKNMFASSGKPTTREQREKREIYEAHGNALRDLWHQQKLDRESLRYAHAAERNEQKDILRNRFSDAREQAYRLTKEKTAPAWRQVYGMPKGPEREAAVEAQNRRSAAKAEALKTLPQGPDREKAASHIKAEATASWREIRGMPRGLEREKAVAELKAETKATFEKNATPLLDAVRLQNTVERDELSARHAVERKNLETNHKAEVSALSKQHICEKLGIHESWRAHDLDSQAERINRGLEKHQDMASVQTNAVKMIELHNDARQLKTRDGPIAVPPNPAAAAKIYLAQSEVEFGVRTTLRDQLTKSRDINLSIADKISARLKEVAPPRTGPPSKGKPANQNDGAKAAREAFASGRALTDVEKANASPELLERADRQERSAKARSVIDVHSTMRETKAKGRGNGRSGGERGR